MPVAIYTRISEDDGTAKGVARQEQDCRERAERLGWDVATVYVDNDVSATRSKRRPEYERMLADVRRAAIDRVIIWDTDRLTRTPREGEDLIDLVENHGLQVANVHGSEDLSTSDGRLVFRIKVAVARREVEQTAKRVRRKNQERAEEGLPHGRAAYGYRRVDGRDVVDDAAAAVLRGAARRVLEGESLRSVCATLNEGGVPAPSGGRWNSTLLRQVLQRPSIAGLRQHRGKIIGQAVADPILDRDSYDRVIAMLSDPSRRQNQAGATPRYLLGGIATCGRDGEVVEGDGVVGGCGAPMRRLVGRVQRLADGRTKRQPAAYACSVCFRVRRNQAAVDELVERVVIARLSDPAIATAILSANDPTGAKAAQDAMDAIDARLAIAADQFADGDLTGDQLKRITAKLRADRTGAERALAASRPNTVLTGFVGGDVAARWAAAPMSAKRAVVDELMRVTIMPAGSGARFDPSSVVIEWK